MIFREATMSDADTILSWRNDPRVFLNFRRMVPVPREEHLLWLAACLDSSRCLILIGVNEGVPVGMVRLDQSPDGYSEVAIIVAPEHQGKGYGTALLDFACGDDDPLVAEIKEVNTASRRIFEKCGFKQVSPEQRYVMYRREPE